MGGTVTVPSYTHVTIVVCAVRGLRPSCRLSNSLFSFVVNRVFIVNSLLQLRAVTVFTTLSRARESCYYYCYRYYSYTCFCDLDPPTQSRLNRDFSTPLRWTCTRSRTQ